MNAYMPLHLTSAQWLLPILTSLRPGWAQLGLYARLSVCLRVLNLPVPQQPCGEPELGCAIGLPLSEIQPAAAGVVRSCGLDRTYPPASRKPWVRQQTGPGGTRLLCRCRTATKDSAQQASDSLLCPYATVKTTNTTCRTSTRATRAACSAPSCQKTALRRNRLCDSVAVNLVPIILSHATASHARYILATNWLALSMHRGFLRPLVSIALQTAYALHGAAAAAQGQGSRRRRLIKDAYA